MLRSFRQSVEILQALQGSPVLGPCPSSQSRNRLCAYQYRTITFDSCKVHDKRDHPPQNFESMIGDADQLINIKLRFRDEPNNTRARISRCSSCRRHARHEMSTRTHEHDHDIMACHTRSCRHMSSRHRSRRAGPARVNALI